MEWQPIETAPKDGTRILLYDYAMDVAVSGCWWVEPTIDTPDAYEPGWEDWVSDEEVIMWDGGPHEGPTHWMPFNPPKTN